MVKYIIVILVLLLVAAMPVSALTKDSVITGTFGTLNLHAEASQTGPLWTYSYSLTLTDLTQGNMHVFDVGNPESLAYTSSANDQGFLNPVWSASDLVIEWREGDLGESQIVNFSYQSIYAPASTWVNALAVGAGNYAFGETIGMGNEVPEPNTIFLAVSGLLGIAGFKLKQRA